MTKYVWSIHVTFMLPKKDLNRSDLEYMFRSLGKWIEKEGGEPNRATVAGMETTQSPIRADFAYDAAR